MRKRIDITQSWEFVLVRGFEKIEKEDIDGLEFVPVSLPHDWMISSPFSRDMRSGESQGFRDKWGTGWYRKNLRISKKADAVYRLSFDGVYENSTVWVNDREVGGRKYGYSGFSLDITDVLREGENQILVRVENNQEPTDRWYTGAGIYRNVYLDILPVLHLEAEEIQVLQSLKDGLAELEIRTGLADSAAQMQEFMCSGSLAELKAVLLDQNGEMVCESGTVNPIRTDVIRMQLSSPILWSAEQPYLYQLKIQLGTEDEISMKVGFRSVELDADKGLFVNGKSVKLKGMCLHQDAGCFGTAVQKEIWKERLIKVKSIGCNALRLAHHLYMPEVLDLCDELGFYVYEESFDKWTGGAYGRIYQAEWEKDIESMVKRDRNRPSILFWGVGNEVENQAYDSMLALLEKHVAKVKSFDSTRPVSYAMNPHFGYPAPEVDMSQVDDIQQFVDEMKTGEIFDMDDRVDRIKLIAEKVDFLACNYQEQWYERIHKAIPNKAILGTETYMYFRGYEECFQNFSEVCPWWDVVEKDYCIGGMMWTGIDYLGESMGYPAKGWSGAVFATDMEMRPIAYQYKSYWSEEPVLHFAVMDYSIPDTGTKEHWDYPRYEHHWEFPQFGKTVIPYMIATNCEQVEIHVNEKTYLLKPTAEYNNRMITGFLPYLAGTVTIIGKNQGTEVCRQVIKTPGIAVQLKFEEEEQYVRLEKMEGCEMEYCKTENGEICKPYQKLLKVRAYDADGNPVFRESAKVQFVVEGPARIIGVDNGDIKSAEPANNDFIHLFQGRANAALLITGAGRVRLSAYAAGMKMAQTVIVAE